MSGNQVKYSFLKGARVDIIGDEELTYSIEFWDDRTNTCLYSTEIKNNEWAACSFEYFVDWKIVVRQEGELPIDTFFDAKDRLVVVVFDSNALGDTIAWMPYVEEFRKQHDCRMMVSTFHNALFADQYPLIEFVEPNSSISGYEEVYAEYWIGLFFDGDTFNRFKNPEDPKRVPMQKIATDILGLSYREIKPKLPPKWTEKTNQVCIAVHSTGQPKYWNNPFGWQMVIDWLNSKGYVVKLLSIEPDGFMGNRNPVNILNHPAGSLYDVMLEMKRSQAFIGIGSGLSWLSWALDVPTVLISGFSERWFEMQDCIRISPPQDVCSGCFNRVKFDRSWDWCPDHAGTDRQYECSRSISPNVVIDELARILK